MWFVKSEKQREREHLERMKCLEQGLPLPDVDLAWYRVVKQRGEQLTGILIVGTIFLAGAPVGATAILVTVGHHLPAVWVFVLLAVVWSMSLSVLYYLVRYSLTGLIQMQRSSPASPAPGRAAPDTSITTREDEARNAAVDTRFFGRT
jgi:hypothetical protein